MKKLAYFLFFISTVGIACPNLEGTWVCNNSEGVLSTTTVTQEDIPNGAFYHLIDDRDIEFDFYADGVVRPIKEGDMVGSSVASCKGQSGVQGWHEFQIKRESLKASVDSDYTLEGANKLKGTLVYKISFDGQDPEISTLSFDCKKK